MEYVNSLKINLKPIHILIALVLYIVYNEWNKKKEGLDTSTQQHVTITATQPMKSTGNKEIHLPGPVRIKGDLIVDGTISSTEKIYGPEASFETLSFSHGHSQNLYLNDKTYLGKSHVFNAKDADHRTFHNAATEEGDFAINPYYHGSETAKQNTMVMYWRDKDGHYNEVQLPDGEHSDRIKYTWNRSY
jgi:hypothetical protein